MNEDLHHRGHLRSAFRLGLLGLGLIIVAVITPHEGPHTGESLWTVARDSTWQKLGDWPAASASLQIMLGSCGLLFLVLAGRQLWTAWFAPRFLHWVLFLLSIAPFVTLVVGLYYLIKAVF